MNNENNQGPSKNNVDIANNNSENDFLEFIAEEKEHIEKELGRFFKNLILNENDYYMRDFFIKLRDFMLPKKGPAKRIRPILLIHSFFGIANDYVIEENLDEIRKLSLSVEFLHNASIIHDDLVDRDEYRRGLPTFHKIFARLLEERDKSDQIDPEIWGMGIAVHGGDIAAFIGASIISSKKFEKSTIFRAQEEYYKGFNEIVRGKIIEQYLQLKSIEDTTLEDYIGMAELKTSKQFETAAAIGAIFADANVTEIKPLRKAMQHLGIAYQIKNDIRDTFGDASLKSIDQDIKEKRRNILIIAAYNNSDAKDKLKIEDYYNRVEVLNEQEIEEIREIIKKTQALEFADLYIKNELSQAKYELDQIYPGLRDESTEFFQKLSDFILLNPIKK
ncbi:MAG: polyprenyl synthetase family protein [Promethearchaeota archaeon]